MAAFDFSARLRAVRAWFNASDEDWADWRWHMRRRVTTIEDLSRFLPLNSQEADLIDKAGKRFRWAITPYALALIDPDDPACPIRAQLVPSGMELISEVGMPDPLNELEHSPVPDLIRVYPDRVALCITDICQVYCRHCFRKRRVHEAPPADAFERAVEYIAAHSELRDILVTGGDPLMFSDDALLEKLSRLRAIPHVQILRVGTRAPCMLPMRVTDELAKGLAALHPLYVNVQFNHPRELTEDAVAALARLIDRGIPLGNQSVLLKGVNDSLPVMKELVHKLLMARARPYYIFHPQLVEGTEHFIPPVEVGLEIHAGLEGWTSGLAVPLYILDTPFGKVPLAQSRLVSRDADGFTVRAFKGEVWKEPNPKR